MIENGGVIKAIVVPGCATYTRSQIDEITEIAKANGAKGLATFALRDGEVKSPVAKFLSEHEIAAVTSGIGAADGDLVLIVADTLDVVSKVAFRASVALRHGRSVWRTRTSSTISGSTSFRCSSGTKKGSVGTLPTTRFSGFLEEDRPLLESDPGGVRAKQYDLTLNGFEIGGGSVRMHTRADQSMIFSMMGHSPEAQQERFGAILDALEFGAPPHGGIAMGIDRWVMFAADEIEYS